MEKLALEQQEGGKKGEVTEEVAHFISVVGEARKSSALLGGSRPLPSRPSDGGSMK